MTEVIFPELCDYSLFTSSASCYAVKFWLSQVIDVLGTVLWDGNLDFPRNPDAPSKSYTSWSSWSKGHSLCLRRLD